MCVFFNDNKKGPSFRNGMENKMTKKGERGWGQYLCHSKYYKFKSWGKHIYHSKYYKFKRSKGAGGSISYIQIIIPKSSTKRGNLSQMQWREKGLAAASLPRKKVQQQKRGHLSQTGGLEKRGHDGPRV